jgi:hypothetical protein
MGDGRSKHLEPTYRDRCVGDGDCQQKTGYIYEAFAKIAQNDVLQRNTLSSHELDGSYQLLRRTSLDQRHIISIFCTTRKHYDYVMEEAG